MSHSRISARTGLILLCLCPLSARAAEPDFERDVVPFLQRNCYGCHDAREAQAGFRIDQLGTDFLAGRNAEMWREVIDRINLGDMPPEGEPRPDPEQAFKVVEWVGGKLRQAEREARMAGGRILMRRLNRVEYANTLGDLLQLDPNFVAKVREELPADGKAEGFDRIASALFFDQTQMAKYLEIAGVVAEEAIKPAPPEAGSMAWEANRHLGEPTRQKVNENLDHLIDTGPPTHAKTERGMEVWAAIHYGGPPTEFIGFPPGPPPSLNKLVTRDGYYRIRVRGGTFRGERGEPVLLKLVYADGTPLKKEILMPLKGSLEAPEVTEELVFLRAGDPDMNKGFRMSWNGIWDVRIANPEWAALNLRMLVVTGKIGRAVAAGDQEAIKSLQQEREQVLKELSEYNGTRWVHKDGYDLAEIPRILVDTIEVEGPVAKQWPPASHVVLGIDGGLPESDAAVRACFARLLPRAYRRPVETEEIESLVGVVRAAQHEHGLPMLDALRLGLRTMLCSPGFVFLQEPQPAGTAADPPRRLNDYELASRLSYFLWSSLPDEELFSLAAQSRLHDPSVLRGQVARMLNDPKSRRFVEGFAGQWLSVDQFGSVMPAAEYRDYDEALEQASREEPLAFFQHVLREDLPVTNFIDSSFLVINQRLAKHYGIEGVSGAEFRAVPLRPEHQRGGVLGMAGLLTLLADGTRTLPIRRAAWVLENLLNDPPAPPPPNAGEIQPNTAGQRLTVRQRLVLHRNEPTCASCHAKLDGYGMALENYDAIGAWRDRQNGEGLRGADAPPIDASGTLKSGREFDGLEGFKAALLDERERFVRAFSEKLLTYALGRPVGYVDHQVVDQLCRALADNDLRIRSLVQAVVACEPFQTK
jgi:hypothetical protein